MGDLQASIEEIWERPDDFDPADRDIADTVDQAIGLLDSGEARVAEVDPTSGEVTVNLWLKHAILLLFRSRSIETIEVGPFEYADKIPLKSGFAAAGVRAVP